jgi:hypothetical protein
MRKILTVLSLMGLGFTFSAFATFSQSQEDMKEWEFYQSKSGKKESRITVGDTTKRVRLQVRGNLESGRILFELRDPKGQERWANEVTQAHKGSFKLDTGEYPTAKGTWVLGIKMTDMSGSYNISWTLY